VEKQANAETGYDRGYDGGMAGDGNIYAHGLDVSSWQESGLDFQNFANAGYDYVILRCGTSYGKDKCFEEYYASARAAGLDIGCYYYSYAKSVSENDVDISASDKEFLKAVIDFLFKEYDNNNPKSELEALYESLNKFELDESVISKNKFTE
jgi:GH25 family lysozyme M1 (1,4-beta-N-acetylmuramidase)